MARRPRPEVSEAAWQAQVTAIAAMYGWASYHTHDSRRSTSGFPDLVLVKPPRLVVVELKRDRPAGRAPTAEQLRWLRLFAAAGAEAAVWRPVDADLVAAVLGPRQQPAGDGDAPYLGDSLPTRHPDV